MVPFNLTRYFNGDMASQRFLNSVTINQGLDPAMFDPNSGYNPNKPAKRQEVGSRSLLQGERFRYGITSVSLSFGNICLTT